MKRSLAAILILVGAAGALALDLAGFFGRRAKGAPAAPAGCGLPLNLGPQEALKFIGEKHPVVMDIRTPEEYAAGRLQAASAHLDYYAPDFKDRLGKLDKKAEYLLYCRSGHRSGLALAIMTDLGFTDIHHLAGGIGAWTAAGLPVVK